MKRILSNLLVLILLFTNISVYSQTLSLEEVIRLTMTNNPELLIEKQNILSSLADVSLAKSEFDSNWILYGNTTRDNTPLQTANIPFYTTDQVETEYVTYGVNHSKKLSNGILMSNEMKFERSYDNSSPTPVEKSNSSIVLSFDIPLLAGKGNFATLQRQAAYQAYKAQIADYEYKLSQVVRDSISLYWKCIGTRESLDILKKSEESMEHIKSDTLRLIKANEAPEAELKKVESGLANRISQRISGETELFECVNNIGLIFTEIELQNSEYPIPQHIFKDSNDIKTIIKDSIKRRKDIEAAELRLEAAKNIFEYAKDNLKNNVSLELKADIKGLSEDNDSHSLTKAWSDNRSDTSYSATVKRVFAGDRSSERNFYQKSLADLKKAETAYSEIKRNAMSEIYVIYKRLAGNWQRLEKTKQALEFTEFSLDAEKKKLRLGMTTVLDVINVEDDHNSTYLNYIQTKVEFISTMVEFAQVTGTLIAKNPDGEYEVKYKQ
jgi:outer membrane protein TolC